MQCRNCSSPLSFLLQVYSPDNKSDTAFRRSMKRLRQRMRKSWQPTRSPLTTRTSKWSHWRTRST